MCIRDRINGRSHYWGFVTDAKVGAGNLYFAAPMTGKSSMEDVLKNSYQFTGKKDRHGEDIFEGDIVITPYNQTYDFAYYQVVYDTDKAAFWLKCVALPVSYTHLRPTR